MASPATLYATDSGYVQGVSTTYATARDTPTAHTHGYIKHGQNYGSPNFTCFEGFVEFDTGTEVPDTNVVSAATFSLSPYGVTHALDFTINVAAYDWGTDVEDADYRTAAELSALTVLATYDIAAGWAAGSYHVFTSTAAMLTAINRTGITRFIVYSARHAAGTQPSGDEDISSYGYDDSTRKPRLVLEYAPAATGNPHYCYAQQQ